MVNNVNNVKSNNVLLKIKWIFFIPLGNISLNSLVKLEIFTQLCLKLHHV